MKVTKIKYDNDNVCWVLNVAPGMGYMLNKWWLLLLGVVTLSNHMAGDKIDMRLFLHPGLPSPHCLQA